MRGGNRRGSTFSVGLNPVKAKLAGTTSGVDDNMLVHHFDDTFVDLIGDAGSRVVVLSPVN